jgi:hypothetical protein
MNLHCVLALHPCKARTHTLPAVELTWTKVHVDMYAHDASLRSFWPKTGETFGRSVQNE